MKLRGRNLAIVATLFVLAGVVLFALSKASSIPTATDDRITKGERLPPVSAGEKAADFKLQDLSGKSVSLSALRGKVVFLNIWATWCAPCREEMPSIQTLYNEFTGNRDFVILAVSQDTKGKEAVVPYVQKNGYHFEVLLDPKNKVAEEYNVSGVPETFIIDRMGRIVAHHLGAFDWAKPSVKEALQELLNAKKG